MAEQMSFKEPILNDVYANLADKIATGQIAVPKEYHIGNALHAAWFKITEILVFVDNKKVKATEYCTAKSIAECLFKMVSEGMNPAKHQCAFIPYGNVLTYQREYQGTIALAKRYSGVREVNSGVVYEGQVFETAIDSTGRERLIPYKQNILDLDKPIVGAWCVIVDNEGNEHLTKMTMKMIQTAWEFSKKKHKNFESGKLNETQESFGDQMAMKTVVNRACKPFINTTNDEGIMDDEQQEIKQLPVNKRTLIGKQKEVLVLEAQAKSAEPDTENADAVIEPETPEWAK